MPATLTRLRLTILACLLTLALPLTAAEITVFAAASLSDALDQIAKDYRKQSPDDTVRFNFAGSNMLARQIREGAPADIFFSADEAQMDILARAELLAPDTRRTLLANTLVIVVTPDSKLAITGASDLLAPALRRLALGEPTAVPAGVYAKAWLTRAGIWEKLTTAQKIIPCENVRAALAVVESGNADAAIVYHTDALISKKTRIAYQVPAEETPGIDYPIALIKNSRNPDAAKKFAAYLASPEAMKTFAQFGFLSKNACAGSGGLQTAGRGATRLAIKSHLDGQNQKGRDFVASGGLETAPPCRVIAAAKNNGK